MAKLTKKQRRDRRKRKDVEYKKRKKQKIERINRGPKPWEPVKMNLYEYSMPFLKEIPQEKRIEIVRSIGKKSKEDFTKKYESIQRWFNDYDPIYVLSFCALYFLCDPEGIDSEALGKREIYHHHIEIMQALALYQKRNYSVRPLMTDAKILHTEMKEIGIAMQLMYLDIPEELKTDEDLKAYGLRMTMMLQTAGVRNWAYNQQMQRVVSDLSQRIENDFEKIYGINSRKFIDVLFRLINSREELLNDHLKKVRSVIKKPNYKEMLIAYNQAYPENRQMDDDEIEELWRLSGKSIKNLKNMLIVHTDLRIENIFSFSLDQVVALYGDENKAEQIKKVFNVLSYVFEDEGLKNFNKNHIILNNPIHYRPFIRIGEDKYFSAVFSIMPHLTLGILEFLISQENGLVQKYNDLVKPKYLEDEIERLFKLHFPNAKIHRGSQWVDSNNKNYENDLTVVIDTFALIIEAKSGQVDPPARRGAPDNLFETLHKLIEEPSEQAHRFISYLKNNKSIHSFRTKRGEVNVIDSSKINYYIPLGITFSYLGFISSNLKELINAGFIKKKIGDLAPSISLTDVEIIFELLPLEAEKIHYLSRRREFEDHIAYKGDEMDLLAFYLENGFNIGETEYRKDILLEISSNSKVLDPYFNGINQGVAVPKPELVMSQWWKDLLNQIAVRKPQYWMETSFILLNTTKEDQELLSKNLEKLKRWISQGKTGNIHDWVICLAGPAKRKYAIVGYPYVTQDKDERKRVMENIIQSDYKDGIRGIVIIGSNLNRNDYPYSVLAGALNTNLFDKLETDKTEGSSYEKVEVVSE
jgi:hypothetical protein